MYFSCLLLSVKYKRVPGMDQMLQQEYKES